jgi:hypothetical protein
MHDSIDVLFLEDETDEIRRADVALDELEVWQVRQLVKVGKTRAVIELIVHDDVVLGVLFAQQDGNM